jgi:hypothetical protein
LEKTTAEKNTGTAEKEKAIKEKENASNLKTAGCCKRSVGDGKGKCV